LATYNRVGLVLPNYNKETELEKCVHSIYSVFKETEYELRILIVDDGSTDKSDEIIERLLSNCGIEAIFLPRNLGKGAALRAGLVKLAPYSDILAYTDSDLDLSPEPLIVMINSIANRDTNVAIGSKVHKLSQVDYPISRRFLSYIYSLLVKFTINLNVRDTQSGQKAFSSEVVKDVLPLTTLNGFAFDAELLAFARLKGYSIREFPIILRYNFSSSIGIANGLNALTDLWSVRKSVKRFRR
jgi:dolichol-phosphate mannosyltransferase